MNALSDFAPAVEIISIRGRDFQVRGLKFSEIVQLAQRFPQIAVLLQGGGALTATSLLGLADNIIDAILALAMGQAEAGVANLALGYKAKAIAAVVRQTAPDGLDPFVDLVRVLGLGDLPEAAAAPAKPLPPGAVRIRRKR